MDRLAMGRALLLALRGVLSQYAARRADSVLVLLGVLHPAAADIPRASRLRIRIRRRSDCAFYLSRRLLLRSDPRRLERDTARATRSRTRTRPRSRTSAAKSALSASDPHS